MQIGEHVRAARKRAGLSQEALARRADMSLSAITTIELGTRADPHYSSLSKIAGALGLSVGELVGEPSPLASSPSASPSPEAAEAGQRDDAPEEEERQITPVSPADLKWHVERMKRIKVEREAEVEAVRLWEPLPRAEWIYQMEAVDKDLERMDQMHGITAHVEDLDAGRELEEGPVDLPYRQFSGLRSYLATLTNEAKVLADRRDLETHVDAQHGTSDAEEYLRSTSPEQRD